ncbi:hypothetical protein [Pedosphaera parvula]|uniref:hypothetical protein n=1 Tax=Pedosphaera parvula TaxID=1032527 RepID=UPI00058F4E17|nr:hypothetical protein [Pedosphaera parvula]
MGTSGGVGAGKLATGFLATTWASLVLGLTGTTGSPVQAEQGLPQLQQFLPLARDPLAWKTFEN